MMKTSKNILNSTKMDLAFLADTHKLSMKQIQLVLRHKAVSTTERYVQNISNDIATTMSLLGKRKIPESDTRNEKEVTD
jgi:hypothetical protein